eukprot:TRINITY_DN117_c3_g5_i1.p1 TRINITY_DN117_c3_g5~~TRINITY_DN117_c3_g5_i1.p1  ORF type:complete len:159 (-),score=48.39 TRINITY_DN117_c3_g5_i1:137-613(-)
MSGTLKNYKVRNWDEFFNTNKFQLPQNFEVFLENLKFNLNYFFSNYLLLILASSLLGSVLIGKVIEFEKIGIALVAICSGFLILKKTLEFINSTNTTFETSLSYICVVGAIYHFSKNLNGLFTLVIPILFVCLIHATIYSRPIITKTKLAVKKITNLF